MAWTAPSTWVSGAILTAAQLNTQLRDNMLELAPFFATWTAWTPRIDQGANTNIAKSATDAKYLKVGKLVIAQFSVTMSASGVAGSNVLLKAVSLPAAAAGAVYGNGYIYDSSTTTYYNVTAQNTGTDLQFVPDITTNQAWGSNPNVALASGDLIKISLTYDTA